MFIVRVKQNRSPIIFGKSIPKSEPTLSIFDEEYDIPQFDYYGLISHKLI